MDQSIYELDSSGKFAKWRRTRLWPWIEMYQPNMVAGLVFASLCFLPVSEVQAATLVEKVLPTLLAVLAVLAGFQGSALSVMMSLLPTTAVQYLQDVNKFDVLVKFHWSAIRALLISVAVCLCFSVAWLIYRPTSPPATTDLQSPPTWFGTIGLAVCAGASARAMACSYRITSVMVKLLRAAGAASRSKGR